MSLLNSGLKSEITVKFNGQEITETRMFNEGEKEYFIYDGLIKLGFSENSEFALEWSQVVSMPHFEQWHAEISIDDQTAIVAVERIWQE